MKVQKATFEELLNTALLDGGSSSYLENLYEDYLKDRNAVPSEWQVYFDRWAAEKDIPHLPIQAQFKNLARQPKVAFQAQNLQVAQGHTKADLEHERKQIKVHELIEGYRLLGHLQADIDPLHMRERIPAPELMSSYYHFKSEDFKTLFEVGTLPGPKRSLEQILNDLKKIYCGTLAFEFTHIPDSPERLWVQEQVELLGLSANPSKEIQKHLLECLVAAEGLEKYLGTKYPGNKRFSLEGNDSLIVALDTLIQEGGQLDAKEIIICMAHRGRLNVLVNILGKAPRQLFDEFEGKRHDVKLASGDVKYHQGFSSDVSTPGGNVHLSLAFNPSHLEIITPVVCGSVKARQERRNDVEQLEVFPIAIHGDAAFAGQGVVMETLNMSKTRGFAIGGTIHIIVNNQIGFTTSDVRDARSTLYCSDIGKMLEIPIFHVNANDPEGVFKVAQLALKYRKKFKKDIIIDLIGYRRQGHNEADEPSATQPMMYKVIRQLPTALKIYADRLINENILTKEEVENIIKQYREQLESRQQPVAKKLVNGHVRDHKSDWTPYLNQDWRFPVKTGVELSTLKDLAFQQLTLPDNFVLHPRVEKIIDERRKMTNAELPLDWGYAEIAAYATLLNEGYSVRLSGQDCGRGTFFHRHVILFNQNDGNDYTPLCHLKAASGKFTVLNSILSEQAVLGFEYGFSNTEPRTLVIWEAQFGDFANNAQGVIDQFISSGEQKWGRLSGLTLFLPHGYEGQGPEHSSARLERYLQLCAEHNIQVCVPTTPSQIFHLLRRQVIRPMRKPLIVLTPKSLLRHKLATSSLQELSEGSFKVILPEIDALPAQNVKKIILCSGKVYYDLLEARREGNRMDVVIIRIEQLYPFPEEELKELLKQYPNATDIVWCQEESKNQGAWYSTQHHLLASLTDRQKLRFAGRAPSAAPSVGYLQLHIDQQKNLVKDALG